jgi:branched-chain amino acid transport system ATP-binding protein
MSWGAGLLRVEGLCAGYFGVRVLWGVDLRLDEGEHVAIIGPNGAGKTTLLKAIAGLIRPVEGEVWLQGRRISRLPAHAIARMGVALVPEGRELFPELSVEEHLRLGALLARARGEEDGVDLALGLFPALRARLRQRAGTLSGGEQQMLAIARALAARPRLLLMDEPSAGLSPLIVKELLSALEGLKEHRLSLLLVEQNVRLALSLCDRAYLLEKGRIVLEGRAAELLDRPAIRQAYLGL